MEYSDTMIGMWCNIALIFSVGFLLFGLSALSYVAFRFLSLVLSMEVGILKEFQRRGSTVQPVGEKLPDKETISRFDASPTEGDFHPYSEEEAFIQEKVEDLRRQGLTPEELDAFVRQAVGTDIGSPEK